MKLKEISEYQMNEYICGVIDILGAKSRMADTSFAFGIDKLFKFLKELSSDQLVIRTFSDNIVIAKKVNNNFTEAMSAVLAFTSFLQQQALFGAECLLRGGITCGLLHIGVGSIFGPALVRAHEIESREAIYPRIIVDENIISKLKSAQDEHVQLCNSALRKDFDNRMYVWSIMMCIIDEDDETNTHTLADFIDIFYRMVQSAKGKPYVLQKYAWWANVMNIELKHFGHNERLSTE